MVFKFVSRSKTIGVFHGVEVEKPLDGTGTKKPCLYL
jgi:hypothetical protein